MSEYTVIDIETIPNESMIDRLPEPEVKYGNTKDPDKRKVIEDKAKQDQISKMALNPLYGRVASYAAVGIGVGYKVDNIDSDLMEIELLNSITEFFHAGEKICTWNGINFDIPFIYKRALILDVKMPTPISYWMKRYSHIPHCDLMQVWCNWYGYEKLDNVASVLLGESKIDFDVTTIKDLIKTGEGREKVIEYNIKDAKLTQGILNKISGVLI